MSYSTLRVILNQMIENGKAKLGILAAPSAVKIGEDREERAQDTINAFLQFGQYRHNAVEFNLDPITQVVYPVFDNFNSGPLPPNADGTIPPPRQVAGAMITTIYWRLLFDDVLPENIMGVIVVIEDGLDSIVTYQIDGSVATYMGEGDLHDPTYEDMVITRDLSEFLKERQTFERWAYTSADLDSSFTNYRIHVYPSDTMKDNYTTKDPIIYAIAIGAVFLFTSFVFILYGK